VFLVALGALGTLGACHSNSGGDGCYDDNDCASGDRCDAYSGQCVAATDGGRDSCRAPTDCPANYTCGEQSFCSPGDCYFSGCVAGFECQSSTGRWECLPGSGDAAGAAGN
jgi:hypothetical protein